MIRHLVAFLLVCPLVRAQDPGPLEADRPDQTESPSIVAVGRFQIESGFSFERENSLALSYAHPSVLMKYGVAEIFEVRCIGEFVSIRENLATVSGLNPVALGFKMRLADESGMVPSTSLLAHLTIPHIASASFRPARYAPSFRFAMQHILRDFSVGYNVGAEWDGESAEAVYVYTFVSGIPLTGEVGMYAEVYGLLPSGETARHLVDGGLTWLVRQNLMVDISTGVGLTRLAPDFFLAAGISVRIPD